MILRLISILTIGFLLSGCDSPEKRIRSIQLQEKKLEDTDPSTASSANPADKSVELYLGFVRKYPDHEKAPEFLYKAAMVRADRQQDFDGCISLLEQVRREYPDHHRAENALFLIAYTYAEHKSDFEKAKQYYQTFLQQYPQSEMKPSVEFELANLGKPVEELDIFKKLSTGE